MSDTKRCARCKEIKPTSEFYHSKQTKDGLYSYCKQCKINESHNRYAPRKEALRQDRLTYYNDSGLKLCKRCGQWKEISEYDSNHDHWDRLSHICKKCSRIQGREYHIKHREEILKKGRQKYIKSRERKLSKGVEWRRNNPEKSRAIWHRYKARKLNAKGDFTGDQWIELVNHYCPDGKCLGCGEKLPLTQDHIIPLARDGTNTIDNLQPLCQSCNSKKGCRIIIDYRPDNGDFSRSLL